MRARNPVNPERTLKMSEPHEFKFAIGQTVVIAESGETGKVIGLACYDIAEDSALVLYTAADGRAVESWWSVSRLNDAQANTV